MIKTIYNKRTGETKQVDDTELSNYGITASTPTITPPPANQFADAQPDYPAYGGLNQELMQQFGYPKFGQPPDNDPTNPAY